jgi:TolB-like protein
MSFFDELKRRNVIRMAGLYLISAWLIVQVAGTVLPMFGAPDWVARSVVILLAIGFVPALIVAWLFELTPEGIKRDAEAQPGKSIGRQTGKRMDRIIVVGLIAVIAMLAIERIWFAQQDAPVSIAADAGVATSTATAAVVQTAAPANPKSIAVLAFTNMSADKDNEYFSDGISEEILNALSKVDDLKVAGRTSSFFFKGKNENLKKIGATLGVANVLEGSVRKQGEKVRITAQLIRTSDGFHLWSETYDGDLIDVFALQEKIAQAIAGKLQVILQGDQKNRLVQAGTSNPEAYQLYLQASSIFNRRDRIRFPDAIAALQRAVQLDPSFARAFARLASLYVVLPSYTDADPQQAREQVMRYAADALALDADVAEAWAARGASLGKFRDTQVQSRDAYEEALRINPSDPNTSFWNGLSLLTTGYRRQGAAQIEHALALDPMLPNALRWRGMLYLQDGDIVRAEPLLQRAYDLGLANTASALSEIAMLHGDPEASARLWLTGTMGLDFNMSSDDLSVVHRGIFGDATAKLAAVQTIQAELVRLGPKRALPTLPLYLFRLDALEQGLTVLRERESGERIDSMNWIWTRQGAAIRALPEFNGFLRDFHLPELWDKYGPPDQCRKNGTGDYSCE